jgi:hypothetical protein
VKQLLREAAIHANGNTSTEDRICDPFSAHHVAGG